MSNRWYAVVLLCLTVTLIGGCFFDSIFLNPETQEAIEETEKAKVALEKAQFEADTAKTIAEKNAATANLKAAVDRSESAEERLDRALESKAPSTAESIAAILQAFGVPYIAGVLGIGAAGYKHIRAGKDRGIAETAKETLNAVIDGVESYTKTPEGKKVKDVVGAKIEKAGLKPVLDAVLIAKGLFKKSA